MTASMLEVVDVSVRYGSTEALRGVSLEVAAGETVAVIGPSGCGKSTLLRSIAGLEPLVSGTIRLGGELLDGPGAPSVPVHRRDLGLMFQDHALFSHLDVAANVAFGPRMQGIGPAERAARAVELLALVGLAGYEGRRVSELSGGEAQRVALARALAPSPGFLMLDEPLGALDRVLREQLSGELDRIVHSLGLTTLHVTHDQAEAAALADRIVVMRAGSIVQVGTPAEVWARPSSRFVAEFMGHPNVWRFEGSDVLAPVTALALATRHPVGESGRAARGDGDRDGDGTDSSTVLATVERVEFREGRFRVTALEDRTSASEPARTLVVDAADAPTVGDQVRITIAVDQLVPLDAGVAED